MARSGGGKAEVQWLDPEEQQAWRAYLETTRLLIPALDRQLQADAGISFTDYGVLVQLSEAPGRQMRMRDLAEATVSTPSAVTRAVTRLEEAGWVRRVECEDDRRGMNAVLTRAGAAKLAAAAPGHVAAVRANVFDHLTATQVRQLRAIHGRLAERLGGPRGAE